MFCAEDSISHCFSLSTEPYTLLAPSSKMFPEPQEEVDVAVTFRAEFSVVRYSQHFDWL